MEQFNNGNFGQSNQDLLSRLQKELQENGSTIEVPVTNKEAETPPRKPGFQPGTSGNPKGKPKGTKHFKTVILEQINEIDKENPEGKTVMERIVSTLIKKATDGDIRAITLLIERIDGKLKAEENVAAQHKCFDFGAVMDEIRGIKIKENIDHPDGEPTVLSVSTPPYTTHS